MYEIEKNVPMPESFGGRHKLYPFTDMNIGDSFFVKVDDASRIERKRNSILGSARKERHSGAKFATKIEAEGGRVWRIK